MEVCRRPALARWGERCFRGGISGSGCELVGRLGAVRSNIAEVVGLSGVRSARVEGRTKEEQGVRSGQEWSIRRDAEWLLRPGRGSLWWVAER